MAANARADATQINRGSYRECAFFLLCLARRAKQYPPPPSLVNLLTHKRNSIVKFTKEVSANATFSEAYYLKNRFEQFIVSEPKDQSVGVFEGGRAFLEASGYNLHPNVNRYFLAGTSESYSGLTRRLKAGLFNGNLPPVIAIATNSGAAISSSGDILFGSGGRITTREVAKTKKTTTKPYPKKQTHGSKDQPVAGAPVRASIVAIGTPNLSSSHKTQYISGFAPTPSYVIGGSCTVKLNTRFIPKTSLAEDKTLEKKDCCPLSLENVKQDDEKKIQEEQQKPHSCYSKGTGEKHGDRVHADLEMITELITFESNNFMYDGKDPPTFDYDPQVMETELSGQTAHIDDPCIIFPESETETNSARKETHHFLKPRTLYEKYRTNVIANQLKLTDPCALAILRELYYRDWVPIRSEFPIFDECARTATAIDIILWDTNRRWTILGELKTGQNSVEDYNAHDGFSYMRTMDRNFNLKDTALNRAIVQLLFSLFVCQTRYEVPIEAGIVIRTIAGGVRLQSGAISTSMKSCSGVQIYRVPQWMQTGNVQIRIYISLLRERMNAALKNKRVSEEKKAIIQHNILTSMSYLKRIVETPSALVGIFWKPVKGYNGITDFLDNTTS